MNVAPSSLVVIGNFDGVHRGHRAVLEAVHRLSAERGLVPRMLTFHPHPAVTLGRSAPPMLTTLERKRELIKRYCPGIDVVVRAFTVEFAAQDPEAFARDVLADQLGAKLVMVGNNFRFGRRRAGGIHELKRFGAQFGYDAIAEPLVTDERGACSSTRVRGLIAAGEMTRATEMLGRPHMLSGTVVAGHQRGRTIGFPTCNIADAPQALPPFGVYAVLVDRLHGSKVETLAKGVANIGLRPTVRDGAQRPLLEVHLFDCDEQLYGTTLRVHLVARLRDEQQFDGLEELQAQIARDGQAALQTLDSVVAQPDAGTAWF